MKTLVLAAAAALSLGSAALAADITVRHVQGETVVAQDPGTVVTFDFAALDTLDALGIEVDGVPGSNLPEHLGKYAADTYTKVGSLFEPDYETVAAMAPDLVIVAARSGPALPELARIAPTIDLTNDWTRFVDDVKTNARILGEVFGKSAEVEALITDLDTRIAEVKAAAADAGTALVILTSGSEVTAFGPGSRFGWLYETLGFTPAAEGIASADHGDVISFEYILEANPDWLIVIDRDAATGEGAAAAILDNELVSQTRAWSAGNVIYLDPVRAYIINGGLPSLIAQVDQIGDALAAH